MGGLRVAIPDHDSELHGSLGAGAGGADFAALAGGRHQSGAVQPALRRHRDVLRPRVWPGVSVRRLGDRPHRGAAGAGAGDRGVGGCVDQPRVCTDGGWLRSGAICAGAGRVGQHACGAEGHGGLVCAGGTSAGHRHFQCGHEHGVAAGSIHHSAGGRAVWMAGGVFHDGRAEPDMAGVLAAVPLQPAAEEVWSLGCGDYDCGGCNGGGAAVVRRTAARALCLGLCALEGVHGSRVVVLSVLAAEIFQRALRGEYEPTGATADHCVCGRDGGQHRRGLAGGVLHSVRHAAACGPETSDADLRRLRDGGDSGSVCASAVAGDWVAVHGHGRASGLVVEPVLDTL